MSSPLYMDALPEELLWAIVQKLNVKAYAKLHKSCKKMHTLLMSRDHQLLLKFADITIGSNYMIFDDAPYCSPVRNLRWHEMDAQALKQFRLFQIKTVWLNFEISLTPEKCSDLINIIDNMKISCERLQLNDHVTCSSEQLADMLLKLKPTRVDRFGYVSVNSASPLHFGQVQRITLQRTDYGDNELLLMKQNFLHIHGPKMTSFGINEFLKQWWRGEREIKYLNLHGTEELSPEEVVRGLPVTILYDVAMHAYSLLADQHVDLMRQHPRKFTGYVLFKADNIWKQYVLIIRRDCLKLQVIDNPGKYLEVVA